MNISEDTYFEWKEKLDGQKNLVKSVQLAFVIYTKVLDKELNDDVTDIFLCKCYIDNLLVTKKILLNIIHRYTGTDDQNGLGGNIVRTLSVLHKVRTHLATRLLEREPSYASNIRYYDKATFTDMHRCLNHIKSGEFYSSQYEFEKFDDGDLARFSLLFRQIHDNGYSKNEFINNIDACLRDPNPHKRPDIRVYRADQSSRIS